MKDFFAFISLILTVVGVFMLVRRLNLWADKPRSGVDKLPSVDPDALTPDHTILILLGGEQKGPYTRQQVVEMLTVGTLPPDALCWQPGQADWMPVSQAIKMPTGLIPPS